ncbi:Lipopolysaccharide assembly protein A [Jeotgalibaca dankookensis]|uniref:Lipopolysaccharide assembly protein A n=1 Tax=Jeotgalibaca dankookensis TaxID=708126 RepID=A0A1S6INN6_9LACT|nr:LapA family protein [Jeotgalibaca dankookensis]AQS53175.1 Lipopolysaccharide assembly protein A [Jeotgalibaca dankookensis]
MKNQWRLLIALLIVILIVIFAILNGDGVPISYGFGEVRAPLIIVITISLLLGSILTLIVTTSSTRHDKRELKSLREKIDNQEFETEEAIKKVRAQYENRIQTLTTIIEQNKNATQESPVVQTKSDYPDGSHPDQS